MAETANKTIETGADAIAFIAAVADEGQRADAQAICALMQELSGQPPRMWGPSIVGFGRYRYRYESGREGEMCRTGFSPRKGNTVVYLVAEGADQERLLGRLGKYKMGKACLYIKKLADVDRDVLRELVRGSLAAMAQRYPDT